MDYEKNLIDITEELSSSKIMYSLICIKASALTITLNDTRCYLDGYYLLCLNITDKLTVNSGSYEALNMQFRPYFYNVNLNHNVIGLEMYQEMREKYGYPDFHLFRERNENYFGILTLNREEYEMIKIHYTTSQKHISNNRTDVMWSCRTRSEMISILRIAEGANLGEFKDKGYEILRYIRDNIAEDLSLTSLSNHFNTNRTTLANMIKDLTNMTPMQYIMEERLNQSRPDLLFTYVSINDVATKYGFSDVNYYVRSFKKRYGQTPHQYRTEGRAQRIKDENIYHRREERLMQDASYDTWISTNNPKGFRIDNKLYGYGFDWHVYVPGATNTDIPEFDDLHIEATPYNTDKPFALPISEGNGIFYNVLSKGEELGGTVFLFEHGKSDIKLPWNKPHNHYLISSITVDPKFRPALQKLTKYLINLSPYKKLYLHLRSCPELNVMGILSTDEFTKLMEEENLSGNIVYILHDEEE